MGVVYRGTLVSHAGERAVAIKQLADREIDARKRARLVAEARLVFRLTHANICQVLDLGEGERGTFVVMELVRGGDLRALLERLSQQGQRLDAACALYVAREVARGLDYAHRFRDPDGAPLGLVHGDVTPQNVLLSVEGEVKLADFGIAHALDEAAPGAGLLAGTPGYVAPELEHGQRDHRVDIYALGVTSLVALTGMAPAAALAALPRLRALRPDVTAQLQDILARATARQPEQRYASAAELERELSTELARRHPTFTPSQLAEIVRAQAPEQLAERRSHDTLRSMTLVDARTLLDGAPASPSPGRSSPALQTQTAHTIDVRPRRWLRAGASVAAALAAALAIVVGVRLMRHASPPPPPAAVAAPSRPGLLPPPRDIDATDDRAVSAARAPAGERHTMTDHKGTERHATAPPHASARRHDVATGLLSVNATPWGAVLVDGKQVAAETPMYRHPLPAGEHVVTVRFADGTLSAPSRVRLSAGELRTLGFSR